MKRCPENKDAMYYARLLAGDEKGARFICKFLPLVAEGGLIRLDGFSDEQTLI